MRCRLFRFYRIAAIWRFMFWRYERQELESTRRLGALPAFGWQDYDALISVMRGCRSAVGARVHFNCKSHSRAAHGPATPFNVIGDNTTNLHDRLAVIAEGSIAERRICHHAIEPSTRACALLGRPQNMAGEYGFAAQVQTTRQRNLKSSDSEKQSSKRSDSAETESPSRTTGQDEGRSPACAHGDRFIPKLWRERDPWTQLFPWWSKAKPQTPEHFPAKIDDQG